MERNSHDGVDAYPRRRVSLRRGSVQMSSINLTKSVYYYLQYSRYTVVRQRKLLRRSRAEPYLSLVFVRMSVASAARIRPVRF